MLKYWQRKHPLLALLLRFFTGFDILDSGKTDATWLFRGQKKNPKYVKVSRWAYLPGWQKMIVRHVVTWSLVICLIFQVHNPKAFHRVVMWLFGIVLTFTATLTILFYKVWDHNRKVIKPILKVVAPYAGLPPNPPRPGKVLNIPRDYADNENAVVTLHLDPDTWRGTEDQTKMVGDIVKKRMGKEWTVSFDGAGTTPTALWKRTKYPPATVTFADICNHIYNAEGDGIIFIGQGIDRDLIQIDLDNESPHVALSMGTGAGKSATGRCIISQLAHWGVQVEVIDYPKRISQNWAKGIPGITIYRDLDLVMKAMHAFRLEMEDRYKRIDVDESAFFPRRVLFIEELNSLMILVQEWWNSVRTKKDPRTAPFITDFLYVLFQGRAAKMHMVTVAQRLEAKTTGGGAGRGQFGTKILARFQPADWKMLVDTYPRPMSSTHPGRAVIVTGEGNEPVQLAFFTTEEAQKLASSSDVPDYGTAVSANTVSTPLRAVDEERHSLKGLIDKEIITGITYDALRKAKSRDPEFPAGINNRYTATEARDWLKNRSRIPVDSEAVNL